MSPKGAGEGLINHYGLIRFRLLGSGNLRLRLLSLSESRTKTLSPIVMSAVTDKMPTRLCNFTQQRASLEIKTTGINETFQISSIIIFTKVTAASYPQ